MRIGIDLRPLSSGGRSGVEEYTLFLLDHIYSDISAVDEIVFFTSGKSRPQFPFDVAEKYPRAKMKWIRVPNKILNASFVLFSSPNLDQMMGEMDVVVFPNINFGSVSASVPYVVVAHDLSFEHFPSFLSMKRKIWHKAVNPRKLLGNAQALFAVSGSTKSDLENTYGIDGKKISIMYADADSNAFEFTDEEIARVRKKYELPEKYVLSFGTLEPRKNMIGLIEAFSELVRDPKFNDYYLVFAGKSGWKIGEFLSRAFNFFDPTRILFTGFVDEADKYLVYAAAELFVYPSFFEGFGFPLVEAALTGTPIISSAHSSILEIMGNGALLVDPANVSDLVASMRLLLVDEKLSQMYARRALKNVQNIQNTDLSFYQVIKDLV